MKENGQYKIGVEARITGLETKVDTLQVSVSKMEDNHIPHIYERLGKIDSKIAYYTGGFAVVIVLADAVINYLSHR